MAEQLRREVNRLYEFSTTIWTSGVLYAPKTAQYLGNQRERMLTLGGTKDYGTPGKGGEYAVDVTIDNEYYQEW